MCAEVACEHCAITHFTINRLKRPSVRVRVWVAVAIVLAVSLAVLFSICDYDLGVGSHIWQAEYIASLI